MKFLPQHQSFSLRPPVILREILTEITVAEAFSNPGIKAGTQLHHKGVALWDTGATNSGITDKVAKELGLAPIDKQPVIFGNSESLQNVYLVDFYLPNKVCFQGVRVTECLHIEGKTKFGVLVGMDIICSGDFAVTNHGGKSIVTYRSPSVKHIDFVEETNQYMKKNQKYMQRQPYYKQFKR